MAASRLVPPLFLVLGFVCPVLGGEIHPPALDDAPRVTRTMTGIHGDPINVGLIGTKDELVAAMLAAKWQPADPITFKSSAKLVRSVVLHRPDETAPVNNLYLWKRKEDWRLSRRSARRKPPSPRPILGIREASRWPPALAWGSDFRHEDRVQPHDRNAYASHRREC